MKKKTRFAALTLAVCLLASLLTLPASAVSAAKTFSDVSDGATATAVESLRLMGVLDGYADGTFRPGAPLTRAQFCKMAVYAMNGSGELGKYRLTTVFPDVKPAYWAASYINMAAKGKAIIAGYPDGTFQPNRKVTVGQAVAILMRLLGYKDEDVGGIWPEGYMAAASTVGLTNGVSADGYAALTRGQAARLFLNLLRSANKDSSSYVSTLKLTAVQNVMLVSSAAVGSDGQSTAMQVGSGATYQMANAVSNGALNGFKGTLLLDQQSRVVTFVPDSFGTSKTVTLSKAEAAKLTDASGAQYAVASDVSVYYNGKQTTWGESYSFLNPGMSLTLYFGAGGGVEYVFAGGGSAATAAVVVYARGSAAGFSALAGGSDNYAIYKNGAKAAAADLRPYDVATYSSATNTIRVCDTRITGYYEDCSPNASAPTTVTVLGNPFKVLPTAADTLSKFSPGQQITLLLTEDNQVAGAVAATGDSGALGNAVGIARSVSASSATVNLLCGITVSGSTTLTAAEANRISGQLVRVASDRKGGISLSPLSGGVTGDLDTAKKTLGGTALSDNALIFSKTSAGLTAISLSSLTSAVIPTSQILYARTDWAGRIDLLELVAVPGSDYVYGIVRYVDAYTRTESGGTSTYVPPSLTLEAGSKTYGPFSTAYSGALDVFIALKLTDSGTAIQGMKQLTRLSSVSNSAWSGTGAVTFGGRTYTVPEDVLCYNSAAKSWLTLSQAHAYAAVSTLYADEYGIIRGIIVG